ncbi:MAG: bifunctional methylenetetrahydrofolate dehydrogenase/methenyltetrahydrofolate cyclohydrolase FolD [Alphaproteobacteria bacterium]|jgi:methylenetetrahydrofolate dehydrogenase (NADP+)/methenyltetrahydrofolate cyclohydrolase|nr:bifunctional methylenetetrahydrofolate dehydrogenase/methenyltetrahydrofolate cyclohydrolase FolD [Alphaproteobacteria bacterium]MDP6621872.1 bifunctional methylenetetrahydrofolate dehydrogenase/methenyltetrahydrofolate cyclohydrolase FolD [Alphaproteobacteria bacterium]|tara:strand:- start:170 stop:1075 length:906 start_codon:yes stop_codon:yes gene_type:complete
MNDSADAPSATVIDGRSFAAGLRQRLGSAVAKVKAEHDLTPGLAVVLVGTDPASEVYTRNKANQTVEAGMNSFKFDMPAETGQSELLAKIAELNADPAVHGILVQLPVPDQIDEHAVINAIDPEKDVDGLHVVNTGRLVTGQDAMVPCTPRGILMLLHDTIGELKGLRALVLGRSNIVGKPVAALLLAEHCTVTMAHSRTRDLAQECRRADILVAAVGQPEMVRGDWIKPGATVIDVGVNRIDAGDGKTRLIGDVAFAEAARVAGAITPVPGGVGPMTIAVLLHNTLIAACRQHGVAVPEV